MVRIILGILLLIPAACFAWGTFPGQMDSVVASGGGGDTFVFNIEFDADTDWSDGYTMGGNDASDGDTTGSMVSAAVRSTAQSHSGAASMYIPTGGDGMSFVISAVDIFSSAEGKAKMWVYPTSDASFCPMFNPRIDSSNELEIAVNSTGRVYAKHVNNGESSIVVNSASSAYTANQWNEVTVVWGDDVDGSGNNLGVQVNGGAFVYGSGTFAAFSSEPTALSLGSIDNSAPSPYYLDDVTIWLTP